jgi:hypothetical protein
MAAGCSSCKAFLQRELFEASWHHGGPPGIWVRVSPEWNVSLSGMGEAYKAF